jgi:hypothetical protein
MKRSWLRISQHIEKDSKILEEKTANDKTCKHSGQSPAGRKARGCTLTEVMAGLVISLALIISVVYFYGRVSAALHDELRDYRARGKVYEFVDYFLREVQSASDITAAGAEIKIASEAANTISCYSLKQDADESYVCCDGTKLFPVTDAWFSMSGGLAAAGFTIPDSEEVNIYACKRASEIE